MGRKGFLSLLAEEERVAEYRRLAGRPGLRSLAPIASTTTPVSERAAEEGRGVQNAAKEDTRSPPRAREPCSSEKNRRWHFTVLRRGMAAPTPRDSMPKQIEECCFIWF